MGWVWVIVIHNSIHCWLWNEEDSAFCLQAARLVFVRYTLCFRSTPLRMFPFNYSPPPHSLFLLALEGKLHNMVEKNSSHGKGGGKHPFYDLSQRIYSIRGEENEPTLLEADVDTVSVIEDGKSWLSHCSYKEVLTAVRDPVMDHLPICGRTAEASRNQIWSHSVILTCKRHQRLSQFGVFFF